MFEKQRHEMNRDCLALPDNISPEGHAAWKIVRAFLTAKDSNYCGGCKAFYTPAEWKTREPYVIITENIVLVVVHDGGDLANVFNLDHGCHLLHDGMRSTLYEAGFVAEAVTARFTYIYKTQNTQAYDSKRTQVHQNY
jgi:hypothetical protein